MKSRSRDGLAAKGLLASLHENATSDLQEIGFFAIPHYRLFIDQSITRNGVFKGGAYYCYCAYVLRISRYSDFLSPMLTNTGIFLRGLKLSGESRS